MVAQEILNFAPDDPRPTLYLTNWSSRKLHGPGRCFSIMAKPRDWERGDGRVVCLTPEILWLDDLREGLLTIKAYRELFEAMVRKDNTHLWAMCPGMLCAEDGGKPTPIVVRDGDTLCCVCSREAAARGECHRAWAAPLLVRAGWRVILDGAEVTKKEQSNV